jgi:hypothetical protein
LLCLKKEEAESLALLRSWYLKSRSLTRRISHGRCYQKNACYKA